LASALSGSEVIRAVRPSPAPILSAVLRENNKMIPSRSQSISLLEGSRRHPDRTLPKWSRTEPSHGV